MKSIRVIGIDLQGELKLTLGSRPLVLFLINHSQVVMVRCVRGSRLSTLLATNQRQIHTVPGGNRPKLEYRQRWRNQAFSAELFGPEKELNLDPRRVEPSDRQGCSLLEHNSARSAEPSDTALQLSVFFRRVLPSSPQRSRSARPADCWPRAGGLLRWQNLAPLAPFGP